ncbi:MULTISPECIES: AI-2E family transporter [unclassified Bradyrhizobium]|uniref:AI-2E family transporter n=1 Tax=unclassified Bradyrhizobium TaxID=2631580 RepID=UPI001FFA8870|nr:MULTISPECIES: AI-2E family transporter [unclassified Bradyrhizobium]MCK1305086.1 AI-2E family transporter [Bradyrhizobium sp. 45]MCK1610739.1 AI-2E family transporter [Bradyrhizobium sp. 163]MCK1763340.1 AI-2E family transporter [Bradyrhizobium sp. 136]
MRGMAEGASVKTLRQIFSGDEIIQLLIRLGLLGLLLVWALLLVRPFIPILAWSVVLAAALNPAFRRLSDILGGRPKLAATILTLVNLAVVIGPATWLGMGAVDGITDLAAQVTAGELHVPSPPQSLKEWPVIGPQLFDLWDQATTNLRSLLRAVVPYLKPFASTLLGFAGNAGVGTVKFLLSVAVAGVLFPYGPQLVAAGRGFLSRIVPDQSEHFLDLAGATIRAVAQGVIGVAIIQALLAGIGFKLAGIASAGLLAFVVLLLSIVQIGGTIVILPVIIWIWTDKEFPIALLLTVFLVIVSVLDNILKPLVMGRGLTTPALVILIGVIGGTLFHGIIGLFIGPIILSVVWELTVAWIRAERAAPAQLAIER